MKKFIYSPTKNHHILQLFCLVLLLITEVSFSQSNSTKDTDSDGINNIIDLDDDNDGILDTDEFCNSPADPFTSLGMAQNVPSEGIYYFNLNGEAFSTYVDADGYVQVAIDFGNGTGNLLQGTALNNTTRGILSPSVLSELTDATEVRVSTTSTSNPLDAVSTNATLLQRVRTNTTLHQGIADNTINDSWTGTNTAVLTADAANTTDGGTSLHENVFHTSYNGNGLHWVPSIPLQRITYNTGEIADTESLHLWVKAPAVALPGCNDLDNDGILNHLDLDSDGDGCPDAVEGGGTYTATNLVNSSIDGGSTNVIQNFASSTVDGDGVPNSGISQTVGDSQTYGTDTICCQDASNYTYFTDTDGDNIGNDCDLDDDNDGILDAVECSSEYVSSFNDWTREGGWTISSDGLGMRNQLHSGLHHDFATKIFQGFQGLNVLELSVKVRSNNTSNSSTAAGTGFLELEIDGVTYVHWQNTANTAPSHPVSGELTASSGASISPSNFDVYTTSGPFTEYTITIPWDPTDDVANISFLFDAIEDDFDIREFKLLGSTAYTRCDTDKDGIQDGLDLDSDGDGCPDAVEGGGTYTAIDLVDSSIDGGSTNVIQNFASSTVDGDGVPNSGISQTVGDSQTYGTDTICCQDASNYTYFTDTDGDNIGNDCDLDDDNDGILDAVECSSEYVSSFNDWTREGGWTISSDGLGMRNQVHTGLHHDFATKVFQGFQGLNVLELSVKVRSNNTANSSTAAGTGFLELEIDGVTYVHWQNTANTAPSHPVSGELTASSGASISPSNFDVYTTSGPFTEYTITVPWDPTDDVANISFLFDAIEDDFDIREFKLLGSTAYTRCDTDNDGIQDGLDLDSDGDGCPDAIEGGGTYTSIDLVNSSIDGGSTNVIQNFASSTVDGDGVPNSGTSQTVGDSQTYGTDTICCQDASNYTYFTDTDGDNIGNDCDLDDDNDGILDEDEGLCANESVYKFDATLTQNNLPTISPDGGVVDLYFSLDSGPGDTNLGNSFSVPLTYSDLNNLHGANNTWQSFGVSSTGFEIAPNVNEISPATTGFYNGLPTENSTTEPSQSGVSLDEFFQNSLANGDILSLGTYTISFGDLPTISEWSNVASDKGNVNTVFNITISSNSIHNDGYYMRLQDQQSNNTANVASTLPYETGVFGKSFVFDYTAFSASSNPADGANSSAGARGAFRLTDYELRLCHELDTDNDGIPNRLDLDSDGDGCPDAIEGGSTIITSDSLITSSMPGGNSGTDYNGTSTIGVQTNLGNNVNSNGVPTSLGTGQTIGESQNIGLDTECCKDAVNFPSVKDSDNDGIGDDCDLDDDNDGILDTDEQICGNQDSPFTSLGMARNVLSAGVYYFNLNGEEFSTYVDADGYVQVAIDFGGGTGNLPQGTALTDTSRGILTPSVLSELTDATEVRVSYTGTTKPALDAVSTNTTLLERITTNTTLHQGIADNTINDSWTGTNTAVLTANAASTTDGGTSLHENVFHNSYNSNGLHWVPSIPLQRITYNTGEIADTESLHLWVKAPVVALLGCNDFDNDGIPNSLDLDSDGDGCPDAIEAGVPTALTTGSIVNGDGTTNTTESTANAVINTTIDTVGDNGYAASLEDLDTNAVSILNTYTITNYNTYSLDNTKNGCGTAMITEVYWKGSEKIIEVANIEPNKIIVPNGANINLFNDGVTTARTASWTNDSEISEGGFFLFASAASVGAQTKSGTSITESAAVVAFNSTSDVITISRSGKAGSSIAWDSRIDVVKGMKANTAYVRIDEVLSPNTTYTESEWVAFVDDNLDPYRDLAAGSPERHPHDPLLSEITSGVNTEANALLGLHRFNPTVRTGAAWDNGYPDRSRHVKVSENYDHSGSALKARKLSINTDSKLAITNNLLVVTNDINLASSNDEIRLVGTSQLVQTHTGATEVTGSGKLLVDQNSTVPSIYRYNYLSSPVNTIGASTYTIASILKDGTVSTNATGVINTDIAKDITFVSGYDGATTSPISLADYWIYTYASSTGGRSTWSQKKKNGVIPATDGFTLKGPGVAQNYTFMGTAKDGELTTSVGVDESYLVGNPFSSAISVKKFIEDNIDSTTATLYFWQHAGEDDTSTDTSGHNYAGYVGGYATRNIAMGLAANDPTAVTGFDINLKAEAAFIQGSAVDDNGINSVLLNAEGRFVEFESIIKGVDTLKIKYRSDVDKNIILKVNGISKGEIILPSAASYTVFDIVLCVELGSDITIFSNDTNALYIDYLQLQDADGETSCEPSTSESNSFSVPEPYIPIGQGFFIQGDESGGAVVFNNSQREFKTEGAGSSVFFRGSAKAKSVTTLPTIKLGMDFLDEQGTSIHRKIGISFNENNSFGYDKGYDSETYDLGVTDMYWKFPNDELGYIIAGVQEITEDLEVPFDVIMGHTGSIAIQIDEITGVDREVFIKDNITNNTYPLNNATVSLQLEKGTYTDRFSLAFKKSTVLSVDATVNETISKDLSIFMDGASKEVVLQNHGNLVISKVELYNLLGQKVTQWNTIEEILENRLKVKSLSKNIYIINVKTDKGVFSKKLVVE